MITKIQSFLIIKIPLLSKNFIRKLNNKLYFHLTLTYSHFIFVLPTVELYLIIFYQSKWKLNFSLSRIVFQIFQALAMSDKKLNILIFFFIKIFLLAKISSILTFHLALTFQQYQIKFFFNTFNITTVQIISIMNTKSYFKFKMLSVFRKVWYKTPGLEII